MVQKALRKSFTTGGLMPISKMQAVAQSLRGALRCDLLVSPRSWCGEQRNPFGWMHDAVVLTHIEVRYGAPVDFRVFPCMVRELFIAIMCREAVPFSAFLAVCGRITTRMA